jgi:uncharacterized protein YciI
MFLRAAAQAPRLARDPRAAPLAAAAATQARHAPGARPRGAAAGREGGFGAARWSSGVVAAASPAHPKARVVLMYEYAASTLEELVALRAPHRPAHLQHAAAWAGRLAQGGAYGDAPPGGLLVFRDCTVEDVHSFARADPYVVAGVVRSYAVRPWTVVVESGEQNT